MGTHLVSTHPELSFTRMFKRADNASAYRSSTHPLPPAPGPGSRQCNEEDLPVVPLGGFPTRGSTTIISRGAKESAKRKISSQGVTAKFHPRANSRSFALWSL